MKRLYTYIMLSLVALFTSCDFDHLHYETSRLALVRIDVDWTKAKISPNGVSAYVYNSNGDRCGNVLSSDPKVVYLKLPAGNYTVVLHNNSISELAGVELRSMERLECASIRSIIRGDKPSFEVEGDEMLFVEEPDDVVSYTLRGVEISEADVNYHYYKPELEDYEQTASYVYKAEPLHIVHLSRVIAHVSGLQYAAGAPKAILRGMSGGYLFDAEQTTDEDVMEEFVVNTKVSKADGDDSGDDTIFVDYNTFGMHANDPESQKYYLDIRFPLIDGSYKSYHIDVTDDIRTEETDIRNRHIIEVKLDPLPEVEGGDDPTGPDTGEFAPTVDDWLDVEVSVPM